MEQALTLKYSGRDITRGEMDAYHLSNAIRGFADFTKQVGRSVHGDEPKIRTVVRGVREGSILIDIFYEAIKPENAEFLGILASSSKEFLDLIKSAFELIKHLQGEAPKSVKNVGDGSVAVENNEGTIIIINQPTINIVFNPITGRATRRFVQEPLKFVANDEEIAHADRSESDAFQPIDTGETLLENVSEVFLTIRTVVLEGDAMWRFFDGKSTIPIKIEDEEFLRSVHEGAERFANGDVLFVRLRATQKNINGELRAEYAIEEVLKHIQTKQHQGTIFDT